MTPRGERVPDVRQVRPQEAQGVAVEDLDVALVLLLFLQRLLLPLLRLLLLLQLIAAAGGNELAGLRE